MAQLPAHVEQGGYLLQDEATLKQIAVDAVAHAFKLGAASAKASVLETGGFMMTARGGVFESAVRKGSQLLSIEVWDGGRTGAATSSSLSPGAIRAAAERAHTIMGQVEPDPDSVPVDPAWLARDTPDVPLYAPSGMSAADIGAAALELENIVLDIAAKSPDLVRVHNASAASSDRRAVLAIDRDFCRSSTASVQERACSVIAERDTEMAVNYWASIDPRVTHLLSLREIASTAVSRTTRALGGRPVSTRTAPVLFDAPVAGSLIEDLVNALGGMNQYSGSTFLPDALGKAALADHLDLVEDPFEPFGLASGAYDPEGVAGSHRHIIRAGTVEGLFVTALAARRLGTTPTGSAGGARNLTLSSRRTSPEDTTEGMLRRLGSGLWLTEIMGGASDPISGAYSKAVAGFWVEHGVVVHPVQDITIAGNLRDMLASIMHVGSDVHRGGVRSGSLLLGSMQIAGR